MFLTSTRKNKGFLRQPLAITSVKTVIKYILYPWEHTCIRFVVISKDTNDLKLKLISLSGLLWSTSNFVDGLATIFEPHPKLLPVRCF